MTNTNISTDLATVTLAAIRTRLQNDTTLQACLGTPARIFDSPPTNATTPYVILTVREARDTGTKDLSIQAITLQITVTHRDPDAAQARQILSIIRDNLHNATDIDNIVRCQEEYVGYFTAKEPQRATARYSLVLCR